MFSPCHRDGIMHQLRSNNFRSVIPRNSWINGNVRVEELRLCNECVDGEQPTEGMPDQNPVWPGAVVSFNIWDEFVADEYKESVTPTIPRRETVIDFGLRRRREVVCAARDVSTVDGNHDHLWNAFVVGQEADDSRCVFEIGFTVQ